MTGATIDELEELLNDLADDLLTTVGEARLAGLLRQSAVARKRYRQWMTLHSALTWDYAAAASAKGDLAATGMRKALIRAISEQSISVPAHMRETINKLTGIRKQLAQDFGREPTVEELAEEVNQSEERVRAVLRMAETIEMAEQPKQRAGSRRRFGWRPMALAAVAAFAAVLSFAWMFLAARQPIATVKLAQGAVVWTDGSGGGARRLEPGAQVRAGTIIAEGSSACVALRFADGTVVTLNGDAELTFSDHGQKQLDLRRGSLNAQVEHQPAGHPMKVVTSAAEIVVLGTIFDLSAASNETALNVERGRVELRRLVDNKVVEVGAQQGVVASFAATALAPFATTLPPLHWQHSFAAPLPPNCEGRWLAAGDDLPPRERAVPFIAGRKSDGAPTIQYGVGIRPAISAPRAFATLSTDSVVRFRYRVTRETGLKCFLSCGQEDGGFGGNFELTWPQPASPPDADGWRWAELPVARASAVMPKEYPTLSGRLVRCLLLHSYEDDRGLEISDAEIVVPSETNR